MLTRKQINQIVRVCGLGFDYWDIPPLWRKNISKDDWEFSEEAEREKQLKGRYYYKAQEYYGV